jgi:hypothetical protein
VVSQLEFMRRPHCGLYPGQLAFHDDGALVAVIAVTHRFKPKLGVKLLRCHRGWNHERRYPGLSRGPLDFRHKLPADTPSPSIRSYEHSPDHLAVETGRSHDLLPEDCHKYFSFSYQLLHGGGAVLFYPCDDVRCVILGVRFPKSEQIIWLTAQASPSRAGRMLLSMSIAKL